MWNVGTPAKNLGKNSIQCVFVLRHSFQQVVLGLLHSRTWSCYYTLRDHLLPPNPHDAIAPCPPLPSLAPGSPQDVDSYGGEVAKLLFQEPGESKSEGRDFPSIPSFS